MLTEPLPVLRVPVGPVWSLPPSLAEPSSVQRLKQIYLEQPMESSFLQLEAQLSEARTSLGVSVSLRHQLWLQPTRSPNR